MISNNPPPHQQPLMAANGLDDRCCLVVVTRSSWGMHFVCNMPLIQSDLSDPGKCAAQTGPYTCSGSGGRLSDGNRSGPCPVTLPASRWIASSAVSVRTSPSQAAAAASVVAPNCLACPAIRCIRSLPLDVMLRCLRLLYVFEIAGFSMFAIGFVPLLVLHSVHSSFPQS